MTALYAMDKLEFYEAVFDIEDFKKNLDVRLGSALARCNTAVYDEPAELLKESGRFIPPAAYVYAQQFDRAIGSLWDREEKKGGKRQ